MKGKPHHETSTYCSTGKRRYRRSKYAKRAKKSMQTLGFKVKDVYRCPECNGWHLTSSPRWKNPPR